MSRNLAASIRARLKSHADAEREDFNLTLTRFGLERLLFRLSVSRHSDRFLLKGALLLGKQAQWKAFLKKNRLDLVALPEVVARLRAGLARLGSP